MTPQVLFSPQQQATFADPVRGVGVIRPRVGTAPSPEDADGCGPPPQALWLETLPHRELQSNAAQQVTMTVAVFGDGRPRRLVDKDANTLSGNDL